MNTLAVSLTQVALGLLIVFLLFSIIARMKATQNQRPPRPRPHVKPDRPPVVTGGFRQIRNPHAGVNDWRGARWGVAPNVNVDDYETVAEEYLLMKDDYRGGREDNLLHAAVNGEDETLCGLPIDDFWRVVNELAYPPVISCKRCRQAYYRAVE